MKILHVCAGWQEWNGAANIARMLMDEQRREGHEVSFATWAKVRELRAADEVWIHCGWLPCLWWAAFWGRIVHWMPEACYDPVRLRYHGWKKCLAGPFERFFLRRAKAIVATCEAEKVWIESYLGRRCPPIEVTDIKRFFKLESGKVSRAGKTGQTLFAKDLHLLYLGRRHPLKGVEYLEAAVQELSTHQPSTHKPTNQLRIVSDAFGEEKEKVWDWCDVLVLPTLSENFGLVIAEALERGKRVITTDGAPAWGDGNDYGGRLTYLRGFRDGTDEARIRLIEEALLRIKRIQASSSK
jgi:glycosyltransferase involved in cell wall biosynthesis